MDEQSGESEKEEVMGEGIGESEMEELKKNFSVTITKFSLFHFLGTLVPRPL